MRTIIILLILALIGLIGCVTKNYYIYPKKVERVEAYEYPSIDPGFYHPVNNLPSFDEQAIGLKGWYTQEISIIPEEWILITKDTIK